MGKGLFAIHINILSLTHKIDQLRAWLAYNDPSIITISETWLNENIPDSDINLDNYTVYRADRGSRAGGVATYIKNNLKSQLIVPKVKPELFEGIFIKITLNVNKQLIIGNIYRPPSSPKLESVSNIISTVSSLDESKELILMGDFNLNWLDTTNHNLFNDLNLTQIIKDPTRITKTCSSLIDLILVTHPNRIINSGVLSDCLSDHCIIFCIWKISMPHLPPKYIRVRDTKSFNTDLFIRNLQMVNWNRISLIPDVADAWDFFRAEFQQVIDKHAPWTTIKVKGHHLPWISSDLIKLFKQRDKAFDKYKHTKALGDWEEYKRLRNKSTTQARNAKANYYKYSLTNNFNNPKQFWNKIHSLIGKSGSDTNNIIINNEVINDPSSIADAFSLCFSQTPEVLPSLSYAHSNAAYSQPCNSSFTFRQVNSVDVVEAIRKLSSSAGPGPDGIESKFIKLASSVISSPLAVLFNMSFTTCDVPSAWKASKVIPLHKGGDMQNVNNYRPISIINCVVKLFEKIIFDQISNYLTRNNLLSQYQSGFRKHFSTTSALLKFTNDVFNSFDNNMCTGAIFLDLTKAFDLVDHYLLLDKLHAFGFSSSTLLWFNSYLHHRRQYVSFRGARSNYASIDKGIPQGSSLGPLLFSLFINDLPLCCRDCNIHLYADDTIIYCSKPKISDINDSLQSDFDFVQQWLSHNKLLLNKKKSHAMLFQRRLLSTDQNNLSLNFLDSSPLESVDTVKYLGVWLETDLSFKTHIQRITNSLNYRLKTLYQSANCFSLQVRKRITVQLLLPILDYADVVYFNTTATCLHPIDVVYNRLCRFVLCCPYRTHHCELYEKLSWLAPSGRRQYHWLQFIFKCIHFDYPLYLKQYLVPYSSPYSLRHHDHTFLYVPQTKKAIGRVAFNVKAPQDWNNLPEHVRASNSIQMFRNAIVKHLENVCLCF